MSFLMTFKETNIDFSVVDKRSDSHLIDAALYNTQFKILDTQIGLQLTFLIFKMGIDLMKVMIAGEMTLEDKSTEVRYISPLYVKYIHDSFIANTVAEDKLKETYLANLDELNDLYNRDYEEDDFEDSFLEEFQRIAGFYITVARSGDHGVMISVPK